MRVPRLRSGPMLLNHSGPAFDNVAHIGQGFDIVDHRGHTKGANVGRKWRFNAWVGALAFQGFDETGFFATDIGPGPTVQEDI